MLDFLSHLDKRWIFLAMFLAIAIPILVQKSFPEKATPIVQSVFDKVESLPAGSRVLVSFDYDPASSGELHPMAIAMIRHLCEKKHKIYIMALWPLGPQMADDVVNRVIKRDYPQMKYGEDYVNLGYKSGGEGVIQVITTDIKKLYTADYTSKNLNDIPMTRDLVSIQQMDFLFSISAGSGGIKEWVQYAATPYKKPIAGGMTGVQAPLMYPYYPKQMLGMLGAIKGAAEYEAALGTKYPRYADPRKTKGSAAWPRSLWPTC